MTNVTITYINPTHRRWSHIERIARAEELVQRFKEDAEFSSIDAEMALIGDNDESGWLYHMDMVDAAERRRERVESWLEGAKSIYAAEI